MTEIVHPPAKRGRPAVQTEVVTKKDIVVECRYGSSTTTYKFDSDKTTSGPYQVDIKHHELPPKPEIIKNQRYTPLPIVMVFKTSKYKNAKTKMKIWRNTNIDWVATQEHLPGVDDRAIILELSIGEGYIEKYKEKYNLN